jgi:hypothetical protein
MQRKIWRVNDMILPGKKFRMYGGAGHEVTFFEAGMEKKPSPGLLEHVVLPPNPSKDIIAFGAKYVESKENLNKAYFANEELIVAQPTIAYKALDIEHEEESIVGHIHSATYVNRATNEVVDVADLVKLDAKALNDIMIDVVIGGIIYVSRFPALEGPVSEKRYAISMECYFDSFDIMLENGIRVTLEEAQLLGWSTLIDQLLGSFETKEAMDAAHRIKVVLADQREVPMNVYKWLKGIMFSGAGLVLNPACPSCHILSTSRDGEDCECEDKNEGAKASVESADTLLTINLTKLDSYMETWRSSNEGKPLNHQVKDNVISVSTTEETAAPKKGDCKGGCMDKCKDSKDPKCMEDCMKNCTDMMGEREESDSTDPFVKDRDPNSPDKKRAMCPQYKYEVWVLNGDVEEQKRHWCMYASDKCPTAGDRGWHECLRWYRQGEDWIMDLRNNRDEESAGWGTEDENTASSSVEYKRMSAMVDSFLYQVESLGREKEIASQRKDLKKPSRKVK